MKENIVLQVFSVLEKYCKNYTKDGVLQNLNAWEQNKGPLVDLLRQHPNWNEDALAVIFEVTHSREIDRYTVNHYNNSLNELSRDLNMALEDASNLRSSLDTAIGAYAKLLPDESTASSIKEISGVSCAAGQKASRVVNKICQRYGLDQHPEYNARFAKLADALNPMQVKRTALLSVHPCDYLEMSNEDNSWSSCHCIRDGEYHAGTLSYMNDGVSMVLYTVDEDVNEDYHMKPKRTRQVFCYGDGILLQSRLYPQTDDEEARNIYRDIVQRTISQCLDVPNLWKLHRTHEHVERHCTTHADSLHYADYIYKCYRPTVSLLKSAVHSDSERQIVIGHTAYCLECSYKLRDTDSLYCSGCGYHADYITCEDCGERIERDSDDDFYINGAHYCRDCVRWCEHCHEYVRDEMTSVYNRNGNQISVCGDCLNEDYYFCHDCGNYFHCDTGEYLDDGFRCNDCLDKQYYLCEICGEYVHGDDATEVDGKFYCASCAADVPELEEVEAECYVNV